MSSLIASSPTHAAAFQDDDATDHAHRGRAPRPSRIWVLLDALGYAGALIDSTGVLASHRSRRPEEDSAIAAAERCTGPTSH
jgi:hypothetical protein